MNTREQRALEIADKFRIVESSGKWIVPSQSSSKKYAVKIVGKNSACDCPDFEARLEPCKHVLAVRLLIQKEQNPDGSTTVTETFAVQTRTTYPQQWAEYNAAQVAEKDTFQELLYELCRDIKTPPQQGKGRRRLPLSDGIYSAVFKVYSTFSARRFMSDLREAKERGFIAATPHFNSVLNVLESADVRPILTNMIEVSALPLKALEENFAVDSTGFGVSRFFRWYDHKYGVEKDRRDWVKVHVMTGTRTNVITACEIRGRDAGDAPLLRPLLTTTAARFNVREVSADKGYLSYSNARAIADIGATPFIKLKADSTIGDVKKNGFRRTQAWTDMYCHFASNREDFLRRYHLRSNVESCFSMMKRKFGDSLRARTDVAMVNEALAKIVCHNLTCLIHEMHETGIVPTFV
jgi:transposase